MNTIMVVIVFLFFYKLTVYEVNFGKHIFCFEEVCPSQILKDTCKSTHFTESENIIFNEFGQQL